MKRKLAIAFVLMAFLLGCATVGIKPWVERTPQEKSLAFLQFYNTQYADTLEMALNPQSTPAQKSTAMEKKALLKKVYPLIEAYDSLVVLGQIPSQLDEQEILGYINQLGGQL